MAGLPRIAVDLEKLEHNARAIVDLASPSGIDIMGVTKACCGDPQVARAMVRGGVTSIADSRIENIMRMRDAGIKEDLILLRTPMLSQVEEVVEHADLSLNSEIKVLEGLSKAAQERGERHPVVLMVEMGDLREGIPIKEVDATVERMLSMEGIGLSGIGTNLACFAGVVPTHKKMDELNTLVGRIEDRFNVGMTIVSGGNSGNIPLLVEDRMSLEGSRVNNLRIGEGILLGLETVGRTPIPGTYQDVFTVEAELIELNEKPSIPDGIVAQNAYGETPEFEDRGKVKRGIVALGRQDVLVKDLVPIDEHIEVLGSSSDHMVLQVGDDGLAVGDAVKFRPRYGALVQAFTGGYTHKEYR